MQPHVDERWDCWARFTDEDGQDLAEYALLLFFVALAAVASVSALGLSIGGLWNSVFGQLAAAL